MRRRVPALYQLAPTFSIAVTLENGQLNGPGYKPARLLSVNTLTSALDTPTRV